MQYKQVILQKIEDATIWIIKINRPQVYNALDTHTAHLLHKYFIQFYQSETSLIAILTSTGKHFCSGYDLKFLSNQSLEKLSLDIAPMGISRLKQIKPVIAAIQGYAVAGGFQLALYCSMIIASSDAKFGVYCRKHGVPLIDGGTVRMSAVIGANRARQLILTGRCLKAEQAKQWGLINRICQNPLQQGIKLCKQIIKNPNKCFLNDIRSFNKEYIQNQQIKLQRQFNNGLDIVKDQGKKGAIKFINKSKL